MDKKCENCKHFRIGSVIPIHYIWGDCVNPQRCPVDAQGKKFNRVFMWADKSCDYFEPKERSVNQRIVDIHSDRSPSISDSKIDER